MMTLRPPTAPRRTVSRIRRNIFHLFLIDFAVDICGEHHMSKLDAEDANSDRIMDYLLARLGFAWPFRLLRAPSLPE